MTTKVNWSDAVKKIIPADTEVEVTIVKGEYIAKSKSSGQPMVNYRLSVTGPDEWEGLMLFQTFSLQPQSLWAFKDALVALNAPESMFEEDEMDIEDIITESVGLSGMVVVTVNTYKEQQQNRIKSFVKPSFDVMAK